MMLLAALCALLLVTSSVALSAGRRHARLRAQHARIDVLRHQDEFVLGAMRSFVEASRHSSAAVMTDLAGRLRSREPSIDAFLAFAPDGDELACVYAEGPRSQHYRRNRVRLGDAGSLAARAAAAGHRVEGLDGRLIPTDRAALAVPMLDDDRLHAVVYVSSSIADRFAQQESIVRAIEHAASPFALALERESDRVDATYDGLTGLLTPRAFRERLRVELGCMRLRDAPLATLWFVDTDRFKDVNDSRGHAAGDRVLQTMAALLRAHTAADFDVIGRNGGDEFCALILHTQKLVAIERAYELCCAVRNHDFGISMPLSASIGVASYPYDAHDANELLEVADAAMYHSKRLGRDCVSFALNGTTFARYRAPGAAAEEALCER